MYIRQYTTNNITLTTQKIIYLIVLNAIYMADVHFEATIFLCGDDN